MTAGLYSIIADFSSFPSTVRGVVDAAVPEAEAALVPVTAGHVHAPIPTLAPSHTLLARRNPSLLPGLGLGLGHVHDPNPGPGLEAAHLRRTETPSPGRGLKANQSLLGKKDLLPKTLYW